MLDILRPFIIIKDRWPQKISQFSYAWYINERRIALKRVGNKFAYKRNYDQEL